MNKPVVKMYYNDDDRFPFSFGVGKARLLMDALNKDPDFIVKFIEENKKK
jgi:hypothetical protein